MSDLRLERSNLRYDNPAGPIFPVEDGMGTPGQGQAAGDSVSGERRSGFDLLFAPAPAWGELQKDNGLRSQVVLSVLTDRLAEDSDEVPDTGNKAFPERRGYWADFLSPLGPDDRYGSRLWLLDGAPLNAATRARARAYILEALEWIRTEGIGIPSVSTRVPSRGRLEITITITDATTRAERRYALLWNAMEREGA
jgi:phage gp46-like protein